MMKRKPILSARYGLALATTALVFSLGTPAFAQVEEATGIADPGRVQDQLRDQQVTPDVSPRIEVKDQIAQKAPPGAENINLNLKSIQLDGVTAYSEAQLSPAYQDQLGTTVTLADVYAIAAALTNKYRNDGYILTQVIVPPQTIEGGSVKLQVVEGYIGNVTVGGNDEESALGLIRRYAAQIQTDGALNVDDLERWLLLINDLPGVDARAILSPSRSQTGAADLRIIVERDPYDALVSLDNFGSRFLGPLQASAAGSLNSYFGNNERLTAQMVVAPEIGVDSQFFELAYGAVSYEQPVGNHGTILEFFGSHTATEPGLTLDEFDVKGRSQLFSAKATHPLLRSRSTNVDGYVLFDWRDVESKNNLELTRRDRIRTLRAGTHVEFLDTILGALGVGVNSIDVEVSRGLNILGSSDKGDANMTRPAANPSFSKVEAGIQRLQRVTSNINVLVAGRGQLSANKLLSSEEFGVGGINFGRAFDPSEIVGENGIAGKIEVQWNEPYQVDAVEDYQLYSFFDAGRIWNEDATSNDLERESITSAGFGVRAEVMEETEAGLAVAFPLNRDVETHGDRDPRFYFNVNRKF